MSVPANLNISVEMIHDTWAFGQVVGELRSTGSKYRFPALDATDPARGSGPSGVVQTRPEA